MATPLPTGYNATQPTIPQLVGKIYDAGPLDERCRMPDYVIRPLGALPDVFRPFSSPANE